MKKLLAVAVTATLLTGCGMSNLNPFSDDEKKFTVAQPSDNTTAVKDQTVGVVNDEGIKLHYPLLGILTKIEVYGMADAWKGDGQTLEILAEIDAKERLTKYLYDNQVSSNRSVEVTARTLDKARDNALNRLENGLAPQDIVFDEEQVEAEVAGEKRATSPKTSDDNTSRRIAQRIEETKVSALSRIVSGGTLRGMRKVRSETRNNGRTYVAVYQWSEEDQGVANEIRKKMFAK